MKVETTLHNPPKVETKKYTWDDVKGMPGLYELDYEIGNGNIFINLVREGTDVFLVCKGYDIRIASETAWEYNLFVKSEQSLTLKLENDHVFE